MRFLAHAAGCALLAVLACVSTPSAAQAYPARPVRLIVPFSPGGSTDIVGRILAENLQRHWTHMVIVDNRAGAGGVVGAEIASQAPPDGHTLLLPSGSMLTAHKYMYKLSFDPDKAFLPITNIVRAPQVVLVANSIPARTINELIALARGKPDLLKYGSAGVGSQIHLGAEMLLHAAGLSGVHVPFKGGAPALAALAGGEVQLMVSNLPSGMSLIRNGTARPIAVTGRQRSEQLPNVPTVSDSIPGFESEGWFGLVAPAGTRASVLESIHAATVKVLRDPQNKPRFDALGMVPVANSPSDFAAEIRQESKIWEKVIRERKLAVK